MARVSVTIDKQSYEIACEEGQEENVLALAATVNEKVSALVDAVGHVGEARMLAMAAIILADEAQELKKDIVRIKAETDSRINEAVEKSDDESRKERVITLKTLDDAATRMENIAKRIEAS